MYDEKILIDTEELAHLLGVAKSTIHRHAAAGKIPKPLRLGGRVLWKRREIEAWVDAGLPSREDWHSRQGGGK